MSKHHNDSLPDILIINLEFNSREQVRQAQKWVCNALNIIDPIQEEGESLDEFNNGFNSQRAGILEWYTCENWQGLSKGSAIIGIKVIVHHLNQDSNDSQLHDGISHFSAASGQKAKGQNGLAFDFNTRGLGMLGYVTNDILLG